MEYASTLIVTIGLGLLAGQWLTEHANADPIWTVMLAIVGLFMGIAMMARRLSRPPSKESSEQDGLKNQDANRREC